MQRRLSGIEALWWAGGRYPFHFALTAGFSGALSVEQLRTALTNVRQKHPVLAVRLFTADDQTWWCTSEGVADFPIRVVARASDDQWMREIEADYDHLFPADSGPLLRFILLQQSDATDLVMIFHHCMYDGLSAFYVLQDILYYLAHPDAPAELVPMLPGLSDLIPDSALQALGRKTPPDNPPASQSAPPLAIPSDDHHLRLFSWALSQDQTTALIQRCREEQTSVHSAICVAFMFAFATLKIGHESTLRTVATPVNLRARLKAPANEAIGMLISFTGQSVDCSPEREFWDAARDFKSQLSSQILKESVFAQAVETDQLLERVPYAAAIDGFLQGIKTPPGFDVLVTNLGVLALPTEYGSLRLEAIYGPMVALGEHNCVCGISTVGSQAFFMLTVRHQWMNLQASEQLIDLMRSRLNDALKRV